jgi:hypothetical protein
MCNLYTVSMYSINSIVNLHIAVYGINNRTQAKVNNIMLKSKILEYVI